MHRETEEYNRMRVLAPALAALAVLMTAAADARALGLRSVPRDRTAGAVSVDLETGRPCWSAFPAKAGTVNVIADADAVYLVTETGCKLIRLDPKTGKEKWTRPLGLWSGDQPVHWTAWTRPAGRVLKTKDLRRVLLRYHLRGRRGGRERAALIDGDNGRVLGSFPGRVDEVGGSLVLRRRPTKTVARLDLKTGQERWEIPCPANAVTALPGGDLLVLSGLELIRVGRADGSVAWRCKVPRKGAGDRELWWTQVEHAREDTIVIQGEDYLAAHHREILCAVDARTGELRWTHRRIHFSTRTAAAYLRFLKGSYRKTYYAMDFPSVTVGDRVGFCDGWGLVEYPLVGTEGRRVWPTEKEKARYEVYHYLPAGAGGWYVGAVELGADRGLFLKMDGKNAAAWTLRPEANTLFRPLVERNGVVFCDYTVYEGTRSTDHITGFGVVGLDARTGKELARRPLLTSHLTDGWGACLGHGLLPCMNRLPYGLKRLRTRPPQLVTISLKTRARAWASPKNAYGIRLVTSRHGNVVWNLNGKAGPIDLATGEIPWRFRTGTGVSSYAPAPHVLPGAVLFPSPPRDAEGEPIPAATGPGYER
jgi:outer membrane protein assembly factor BamB